MSAKYLRNSEDKIGKNLQNPEVFQQKCKKTKKNHLMINLKFLARIFTSQYFLMVIPNRKIVVKPGQIQIIKPYTPKKYFFS